MNLIKEGDQVELLFLNGGANDIDFKEILDPREKDDDKKDRPNFLQFYGNPNEEKGFRKNGYEKLKTLIRKARMQCPNAVIVVPGYFSPLSMSTNHGKLQQFFEDMSGQPGWKLLFNNVLVEGLNIIPFGPLTDLDDMVWDSRRRSLHAVYRSLYWMKRAVTELNENAAVRGPGLIFVPTGFKSENSIFTSNPFLHQEYKPHKVKDKRKKERIQNYPRSALEDDLTTLYNTFTEINQFFIVPKSEELLVLSLCNKAVSLSKKMLKELKGPRSLVEQLTGIASLTGIFRIFDMKPLESELGRIHHNKIASFLHPNEAGAEQIARNIVHRFQRFLETNIREDITRLATTLNHGKVPETIHIRDSLLRYGLDPSKGLRSCMQHMLVDSIAIEISVSSNSTDINADTLILTINPEQSGNCILNIIRGANAFPRRNQIELLTTDPLDTIELNPGFSPIAVFDQLHLADIKQCVLSLTKRLNSSHDVLIVSAIKLLINGVKVFESNTNFILDPLNGKNSLELFFDKRLDKVATHDIPYPKVK